MPSKKFSGVGVTKVPSIIYCATMLVAALLNMKVGRIVTGREMVSASADPQAVRYVRARGLSVVLGSATAIAVCFLLPRIAQGGLVSIPIWRWILIRGMGAPQDRPAPKRARR